MKNIKIRKLFILIILVITINLIAGCGKKGENDSGFSSSDVIPSITSAIPLNNAQSVAINGKILVFFSKAMKAATINASSFKLADKSGISIPGTVTYVAASRIAIFTPSKNLSAKSQYIGTITTGVEDNDGKVMTNNYVWTFTTGTSPDITTPRVIATINLKGNTGVPLNTLVGVTFSEAIDPLTLNSTTFTLTLDGIAIPGSIACSELNAVFTPLQNLLPNKLYTSRIVKGAKDLAGNSLAADYTLSWTTGTAIDPLINKTDVNKDKAEPETRSNGVTIDIRIKKWFSGVFKF